MNHGGGWTTSARSVLLANAGLLRLIFAACVIVGHAPEMIDGNPSREPLTMVFHSIALGEVSVDAFFLLSGFMITQAIVRSSGMLAYFQRRALRIYPGYIAAFLLSVYVFGVAVGANPFGDFAQVLARMALLQEPGYYSGELMGLPYPALNGSMWTICYEVRAYLLVSALSAMQMLGNRRLLLAFASLLAVLTVGATFPILRTPLDAAAENQTLKLLVGRPAETVRLLGVFMMGATIFAYWRELDDALDGQAALRCAAAAAALAFVPHLAEMGVAVFGGLALFWLASKADLGPLRRINCEQDISYGVYLYGWPIANLIRWHFHSLTPLELASATLPFAVAAGTASWFLIEKPALKLVRSQAIGRRAMS